MQWFSQLSQATQVAILLALSMILINYKDVIVRNLYVIAPVIMRQKKLSEALADANGNKVELSKTKPDQVVAHKLFRQIKIVYEPVGSHLFMDSGRDVTKEIQHIFSVARMKCCEVTILMTTVRNINKNFHDGFIEAIAEALDLNNIAVKIVFGDMTTAPPMLLSLEKSVRSMIGNSTKKSVCCEVQTDIRA